MGRPIRILIVSNLFPPDIGGPATYDGFAALRSMIAVVAVPLPPMTITFWSCAGGRSTLAPWSRLSTLIAELFGSQRGVLVARSQM